jgi:alanyl-tRNA synthetase
MMLFGEKYGESVRVLDIGSSRELCGGTHVQRTGDIGLFKVVAESGVASGVRRIEALTGQNALSYVQELEDTVTQVAGALKAPVVEINDRIASVLDHARALEKEIAALKGKLASAQGDEMVTQAVDVRASKCWWRCWQALTPRLCATPWTSSKTNSKPPSSCWRPWTATRCRLPPA